MNEAVGEGSRGGWRERRGRDEARIERRKAVRRALHVPCQVMLGGALLSRRGLDISPRGLLVASDAVVKPGERVRISIHLPLTRAWLRASATVARVVLGRREGDRERALALELDPLDADTELFLSEYLKGIPVPLARAI